MQATTSGAIHKNNVFLGDDIVGDFLSKQKSIFSYFLENKSVLYNKDVMLKNVSLNYLNHLPENKIDEPLKNIILKEYYDCEKIYPYLGDYLLFKIFAPKSIRLGSSLVFNKSHQNSFIDSLKSLHVKNLAKWFFENTNLNRNINVETYIGNDISVEAINQFIFDIDYDYSFFNRIKEVKSYRYVLINGIIESIGEIHHLLHIANQTKEPYVLFCFGISEEVKTTIIKNNNMGRFIVLPVCLNVHDENNLNIMNDIAAILGTSIVSSDLGQTISQEIRKALPVGKHISFFNNKISIEPSVSKKLINKHRNFLKKRIEDAETKTDVRIDVLRKRLKMFTNKRINVYIPKILNSEKNQLRELDYLFRFFSNISNKMKRITLDEEKFYIPVHCINIVNEKQKSLLKNLENINAIIT